MPLLGTVTRPLLLHRRRPLFRFQIGILWWTGLTEGYSIPSLRMLTVPLESSG